MLSFPFLDMGKCEEQSPTSLEQLYWLASLPADASSQTAIQLLAKLKARQISQLG